MGNMSFIIKCEQEHWEPAPGQTTFLCPFSVLKLILIISYKRKHQNKVNLIVIP